MKLFFFMLFGLLVFLLTLVGYRKYRFTTLYALAIGGIVNANFFHAGSYPINCFGLPFGIDSIIYTLFIFCVFLMFIKEGKKQAYLLSISSVLAIIISATFQLATDLLTIGVNMNSFKIFLMFFISAFASIIAIVILLEIFDKIKNKINKYLLLLISIFVVSIVNSVIYYPIAMLLGGVSDNIGPLLLTSVLGKLIALGCSFIAYFLINKLYENKGDK